MYMNFKKEFSFELIKLNLTKKDVFEFLEISRPTFDSRLKYPNTFKLGEIKKLNQLNININYFKNDLTRKINSDTI